jgi:hypothetical protein
MVARFSAAGVPSLPAVAYARIRRQEELHGGFRFGYYPRYIVSKWNRRPCPGLNPDSIFT